MNDEADDLAGSLRVLAGEERRRQGPDSHPSAETLTAYHAGELTTAAEEQVQEHLAVCRHCTGLLLDLPAFLEVPESAAEPDDADLDTAWQAIRGHLPGPPRRPETRPLPQRRTLLRLAAAAVVVLAVAPLWVVARRLASPTLPPATLELYATETPRGPASPPPPPATVHAAAASTTLVLRLARDQPGVRFALELRAAGSGAGSATPGAPEVLPVTKTIDSHTLLLVLARHQLTPGSYRLRVLDAERPAADPLAEYALEVVEP